MFTRQDSRILTTQRSLRAEFLRISEFLLHNVLPGEDFPGFPDPCYTTFSLGEDNAKEHAKATQRTMQREIQRGMQGTYNGDAEGNTKEIHREYGARSAPENFGGVSNGNTKEVQMKCSARSAVGN